MTEACGALLALLRFSWRRRAVLRLLPALFLCTPLCAQHGAGMEEFAPVDPYTGGDPERMALLGYVSFGPFPWLRGDSTAKVQENMGAIPILWVETAHFRIGSSLNTYRIPGDSIEKARLADEIDRLRRKLGKLKTNKRELDPWLRLHLYAQRMEELYAAFLDDFDLEPSDYEDAGPHLGQTEKLRLLLCERTSEYTRHASLYLQGKSEDGERFGFSSTGMGFATNQETLRMRWLADAEMPFDSVLFCTVANAFGHVLLDAYRRSEYDAPQWLGRGYAHLLSRRVDARYPTDAGYESGQTVGPDDWKWEQRVASLVESNFFTPTADLFGWTRDAKLEKRDHLIAWSRVDFLIRGIEGDRACFLAAVCQRAPQGAPETVRSALVARQEKALQECFARTPTELDQEWAAWVKKTYAKR